jgi:2,3-bisphosphoglycerate-dependent phosphoglycerate mutase
MPKLVLLRHGESVWNAENRFTGWTDVPLSKRGKMEAQRAGELLSATGLGFDIVYTSVLSRAVETVEIVLGVMGLSGVPVIQAWELNERHYGCLQSLSKAEAAQKLGVRRVMHWRRSFEGRPPAMEWDDPRHARFDPRYASLPPESLPCTESLHDTLMRLLPCWHVRIAPALRAGQRVLLVGHGNTLRPLVKYLDNIPDRDVINVTIYTGIPRIYDFNIDLMNNEHYDITI